MTTEERKMRIEHLAQVIKLHLADGKPLAIQPVINSLEKKYGVTQKTANEYLQAVIDSQDIFAEYGFLKNKY